MRFIRYLLMILLPIQAGLTSETESQVRRFINPEGWVFPGAFWVIGEHATERSPKFSQVVLVDGNKVKEDKFIGIPISEKIDDATGRFRYFSTDVIESIQKDGDAITIKQRSVVADSITRYSLGEKIFCYKVMAKPCDTAMMRLSPPDKPSVQQYVTCMGALYEISYYDNDGDGRFETMETYSGESGQKLRLSSWALQK
jgi:hypothetical protein